MYNYDFKMLCALHFAAPRLPEEIREVIFRETCNLNKLVKRPSCVNYGQGMSKSAIKRRAARLGKCSNCGNWAHSGRCKPFPSRSQCEMAELIQKGAIRLKAERPLRSGSIVREHTNRELEFLFANLNFKR